MPGLKKFNFIWQVYYGLAKLVDPLLARILRLHASKSPNIRRVRVLVYSCEDNQILLVKNVVGSKNWTFPGGGVEAGESDQQAASRELEEELSLKVDSNDFSYLYTAEPDSEDSGVRQLAPVFFVAVDKNSFDITKYRKIEIMEVTWARIDELPPNCSLLVKTTVSRLPEFSEIAKIDTSRSESERVGYEKHI